jgi:hypothetical protein
MVGNPLDFACPQCAARLRVKAELAGRTGKCPHCAARITVPAVSPPASAPSRPADSATLTRQILGRFKGPIEPVRVSIFYRLGLVLVASLMIALPLVYVALICGVGFLMYFHATHSVGLVGLGGVSRLSILTGLVYVAPLVGGLILLAFMVRPLFARRGEEGRTRTLTRLGEPLLFAFIDRLCEAVAAPRPTRIQVDCDINASAWIKSGPLGLPLGCEYTLTLGVPLVATFTVGELGGVIAHELGHFTQGSGIRATQLIRSVNAWFARVVYQRDWDEQLIGHANDTDIRIALVLALSMLFVWIARGALWCLMIVGHAAGSFMLRQMEYHADLHEIRVAGSAVFPRTTAKFGLLQATFGETLGDLSHQVAQGKLGDNLPKLISFNFNGASPDVVRQVRKGMEETATGLLDSHPAGRDRIAAAHDEADEGVFHCDLPASSLFVHYEALCKNVTWDVYRHMFGAGVLPSVMHPVEELLAVKARDRRRR